jgi:ribosomal protein S18 acetylase RimI-like enzyme
MLLLGYSGSRALSKVHSLSAFVCNRKRWTQPLSKIARSIVTIRIAPTNRPSRRADARGLTQVLGVYPTIMHIRQATIADFDAMWDIFQSVIATGDALPFSVDFDQETFHAHWLGSQVSYVAVTEAGVLGMYKLGSNYPAHGSHVASATYAVSPPAQGKGIGRALINHSLAQAQGAGYMAMQFNYVVSTNAPAVELYKKLGFAIVGTLPKAFRHQQLGLVDAYVMFRFLQPQDT